MKYLCLIALFCISTAAAFAQTQRELNEEANLNYRKADKELNTVYQRIIKERAADKPFIKNLKNAQRIWIQLRDAEILTKYPLSKTNPNAYGSAHPMCWSMYLTELTHERTEKLKVWLTKYEEGDICKGTFGSD
jgi:uncharacterized protein YecT (DUF1311 family)